MSAFSAWRHRRAVHRWARAGTPEAARALADAVVADPDPTVVAAASRALRALDDPAAVEAACDTLVETGDEGLATALAAAPVLPSDPRRRAALFFLAGDDRYADLDLDAGLLRATLVDAGSTLRTRLTARARAEGRVEWVRAAAGHAEHAAALSEADWDDLVDVLAAARRWDELWRWLAVAPPVSGVRILHALGHSTAPPVPGTERRLLALAALCAPGPPPGIVYRDRPTTIPAQAEFQTPVLSADGRLALVWSADRVLSLWRLPSGAPAGVLPGYRAKRDSPYLRAAVAPDGRWVAAWGEVSSASSEGVLRLWELPADGTSPSADPTPLEGAPGHVSELAFSPDGALLACYGWNPRPRGSRSVYRIVLWRVRDGRRERTLRVRCAHYDHELTFAPDASLLVADCMQSIHRWSLPGGERLPTIDSELGSVLWISADGTRIVHRAAREATLRRLSDGVIEAVASVDDHSYGGPKRRSERDRDVTVVTPDGGFLLSSRHRLQRLNSEAEELWFGEVRRYELRVGGTRAFHPGRLASDPGTVKILTVTPDSRLAAGWTWQRTGDCRIHLWHVRTGALVGTLPAPGEVTTTAFATPEALLGKAQKTIRIWPVLLPCLARTPLSMIDTSDVDALRTAPHELLTPEERDWTALIGELVLWSRRHDIALGEPGEVAGAGADDIELA